MCLLKKKTFFRCFRARDQQKTLAGVAFSSSAALNPHRIPIGTSDEETSCATMEETFPTADTKRLEEKHDGWLGVGVGVGACSTTAGGRDQKITPSGYQLPKRGSGSGIILHHRSPLKNGVTIHLGQFEDTGLCVCE